MTYAYFILQAPPIRLLILGPKGSGKSLHGRHLARKLGLFHIQFRERLQELVIAKTKKKIGPEYEEEEEEPEPVERSLYLHNEVSVALSIIQLYLQSCYSFILQFHAAK